MEPLSVYIHIPWCVKKCPYCDFNSHPLLVEPQEGLSETSIEISPTIEESYVKALCYDLTDALKKHPELEKRPIQSIFFGGGTPSLFSPSAIANILAELNQRLWILPQAEITLEANAGVTDTDRFKDLAAIGITRLSLGVQSFNDQHLQAIGRIHNAQAAQHAAQIALDHFTLVNIDLMYALPHQTLDQALSDIKMALSLSASQRQIQKKIQTITHLSVYQLTIEPNTLFAAKSPPLPDDDTSADMGDAIESLLESEGFIHYEISAFAKPGFACKHNLHYWTFGDYLGLGAGAHSKIRTHGKTIRQMRWKHPRTYIKKAIAGQAVAEEQTILLTALPFEFLMNALRLSTGFTREDFETSTGIPMTTISDPLQQATSQGLLTVTEVNAPPTTLIQTTKKGQQHLNGLLGLFL